MKIIVEQSFENSRYSARIYPEEEMAGCFGDTAAEAIGELVGRNPEKFNIQLEVKNFED